MIRDIRPGDRVEFGPADRPLTGEVHATDGDTVSVIVDDFMGRRVLFRVTDIDTVRRIPVGLRRS